MPSAISKRKKHPHVELAMRYARDVVAGKILACKWVIAACLRHRQDLKKKDFPYRFDKKKAERACRFIELLPHTKGRWAAKQEKIVLQPWQCFLLCSIFGWVRKGSGLRRFREAYCEIPRKSGKSLIAAGIGLYCFAADGEHGAEVFSGATTEKQAWEIFRPARLIAFRMADLREEYGIAVNASNLAILENGSRFEPLIGNPGDGASPHCVLIDEYHEHADDSLYESMVSGMGAREQPLTFIVTTAGSNLAGPCYVKRDYVTKILSGTLENDELFGIIYTIDLGNEEQGEPGDDWTSEAALQKANPNYGVSVNSEYLLSRQREAQQLAYRQNGFKTKNLNIWVGAMQAWMNLQRWNRCPPRAPLDQLAGRRCFAGLDLASKLDLAALVLLFPPTEEDPLYHVHGRYYLPEDAIDDKSLANVSHYEVWARQGLLTLTPGNVTDFEYIKDDIRDFHTRFPVVEVAYDPWQAWQLASELLAEAIQMVQVNATVKNFSEPMKELEKLVWKQHLAHGGCPLLTWMVSNVVARLDKKDNIYPVKERPEKKIDGIVALIMALSRALLQPVPGKSMYEEEGLAYVEATPPRPPKPWEEEDV